MSENSPHRGQQRQILGLVVALAVFPILLAIVPGLPNFFLSGYYSRLFDDFVLFAILAVMLNLVFGHTDQLYLFIGGLAGVSAYTTALLADTLGVSPLVTLFVGTALAGGIGLLVSWISAKRDFSVILISILTLTLQLALTEVFVGARDLTGGSTGRSFPDLGFDPIADAIGISAEVLLYYALLVVLLLAMVGYVRLIDSGFGLALETIRQDEEAARSIGVNVVYYKSLTGLIAALGIGFTGVLLAQRQGFILPTTFSFQGIDVLVLIMLIVGGLRTTYGPVLGAAIVSVLEEGLQRTFGEWETFIFGALLIVLFLYFRSGIVPALRGDGLARLRGRVPGLGTPDAGGEESDDRS